MLSVVSSSPDRHIQVAWSIALDILHIASQTLINTTAEVVAELIARIPQGDINPMEQALKTIETRFSSVSNTIDDLGMKALGTLISSYTQAPKSWNKGIDSKILDSLRNRYSQCGSYGRTRILELYATPGISKTSKLELLLQIIKEPIKNAAKERDNAIELLKALLPQLTESPNLPFGNNYLEALYYKEVGEGWDVVQTAVVGYYATFDDELLDTLVNKLLEPPKSKIDAEHQRRHHIAVCEAIKEGAVNRVISILLAKPISEIPKNRLSTVSTLIREFTQVKSSAQSYVNLAQWILPNLNAYPDETLKMLDMLTSANPAIETILTNALTTTLQNLPQNKLLPIFKFIHNISNTFEPYLNNNTKHQEARLALVRMHRYQAIKTNSVTATQEIFTACLDKSRDISLEASKIILELCEKTCLDINTIISTLSQSKISGVHVYCLQALAQQINIGCEINDEHIIGACDILFNEKIPEVLQHLYKLIETWVQAKNNISSNLAEKTFELTNKFIDESQDKYINATVAGAASITLKNIANLENTELNAPLGKCLRKLFRRIDVIAVNVKFIIGLLDKIAKIDNYFLATITQEDIITEHRVLPRSNLDALVVAITHNQGINSPLLDEILKNEQVPLEIKSQIKRERNS